MSNKILLNNVCCFLQKYYRQKAAKEHARQKLQDHAGLPLQSVHSVKPVDDSDGPAAKLKKCCVSFKLSSPGSSCRCGAVSTQSTSVCGVSSAGVVVSEKNKGFVADVSDEQSNDLQQSDSLHSEIISVAEFIKPDCHQPSTSRSVSEHNSASHEDIATVSCSSAYQHVDLHSGEVLMPQQVATMPENVSRQCALDLHLSEKSDLRTGSSSIANGLNASQKLRLSSTQNASALLASSSGCELNFSSLDDNLLACLVDSECFPCDYHSAETEPCKEDISGSVSHSVEPDSIDTVTGDSVENRETSVDSDDTASLCRALSAVKIAVGESVKSGVTDFALPDSQYGEIIRQKVSNEDGLLSTVDNNMVERMMQDNSFRLSDWSSSPLPLSTAGQQSIHHLQQNQRYVCQYTVVCL